MAKIVAKPEVCIGCHLCEIWCVVAHSGSGDVLKAFLFEGPPPPRIVVEERLPLTFALPCRHCAEPDCVFACIAGALSKDPQSGRVRHDESRCVGCYGCVMACPYGAIVVDPHNRRVVKCDLCEGRDLPVCVARCPNGALAYVDEGGA
ncbi:MAG: 4Fe-4S dicluster domain-containing protein [Firmicutes bacterium]|nr:4Fe-4S dicluster domain-containing protein [Bacillota bacterium]